jgi:NAD-dependent dihydropyrimidine dehydrogenase PreA subunit
MSNRTVTIDSARCTGCGDCVDVCPRGAISIQERLAVIEQNLCSACLACVPVCEAEAIVVTETVALAQRPEMRVQPTPTRSRTVGTALASLGGAALAYFAERVLPEVIDRLTRDRSPDIATPENARKETGAGVAGPDPRGGRRRRRRGG